MKLRFICKMEKLATHRSCCVFASSHFQRVRRARTAYVRGVCEVWSSALLQAVFVAPTIAALAARPFFPSIVVPCPSVCEFHPRFLAPTAPRDCCVASGSGTLDGQRWWTFRHRIFPTATSLRAAHCRKHCKPKQRYTLNESLQVLRLSMFVFRMAAQCIPVIKLATPFFDCLLTILKLFSGGWT